jgi:hypothetical protein
MTYQELLNHTGYVTTGFGSLYHIIEVKYSSVVLEAYWGCHEEVGERVEYPHNSVYEV